MINTQRKKAGKKMKINRVILSLVFLVLGFMIAFSYQLTKKQQSDTSMTDHEWERTIQLRNDLIDLEEKNRQLQKELNEKQAKIIAIENEMAENEKNLSKTAKEAEKLRMILGKVKVQGEGVIVTLNDGKYNHEEGNVNNFIVHEHHVLKTVNELYISGAEAIAINGKRLKNNSYIVCDGPVITVDGEQFPAPFIISAIGDKDTLEKALTIQGGVKDQLVSDNIVFKLEKLDRIVMDPTLGNRAD